MEDRSHASLAAQAVPDTCAPATLITAMPSSLKKLYVHGFPGFYGGAGTELHHQIILWLHMGMEVHLIPSRSIPPDDPMHREMLARGVRIHAPNDWSSISPGDPVFGFCNAAFLQSLPHIKTQTNRTVFVNCMTWLFPREKEAMLNNEIAMFLYQNEDVRQQNMPILRGLNPDSKAVFHTFTPYFHHDNFPYIEERPDDIFGCGRISRQNPDKFSRLTLHIYEYFVSPRPKRAIFLGFDERSEQKIGKPFPWIRTVRDHRSLSQQDFYRHSRIILQPTDTHENWPRVGFEAMSSGSVLIVNDRGGWQRLIEHGKTGWLCKTPQDFIYYASKMAYEPNLRDDMAAAARERGLLLGGMDASIASWSETFEKIQQLPE